MSKIYSDDYSILSEGFFGNLFKPDPIVEKLGLKKIDGDYVTDNYPIKILNKTFKPRIRFFGGINDYQRKTFKIFEEHINDIYPTIIKSFVKYINDEIWNITKDNDPNKVNDNFLKSNIYFDFIGFFDTFEGFGFVAFIQNNNLLKNFGFSIIVNVLRYPNDIDVDIHSFYLK